MLREISYDYYSEMMMILYSDGKFLPRYHETKIKRLTADRTACLNKLTIVEQFNFKKLRLCSYNTV